MMVVRGEVGEHVSRAIERLVRVANEHGEASLVFNETTVKAKAGDSPDELARSWEKQRQAAHEAWINSEAGKRYEAEQEAQIAAMQERHDCLVADMRTLDWSDDVAVLDWVCAMQSASDHVGVCVDKERIITTFARHGFMPDVNTGAEYREGDRENEHKYLIGQALSTLEVCAIHGIIHSFAERWKAKFAPDTSGESH